MGNIRQLSFSSGEITPALYARVDQSRYATGLKTLRNFIVQKHGGVTNRSGTGFVSEVKDSTKRVRYIPFVTSLGQSYVLEFGHLYMRVHKNGGQVLQSAQPIVAATKANPAVITTTSLPWNPTGDEIYINGVLGMTELNNRNFKVTHVSGLSYSLQTMDGVNLDSTLFGTYISGGTGSKVYEISTPWGELDLPDIQFVQSGIISYYGLIYETMRLVHPSYPIRQLWVQSDANWTLSVITMGPSLLNPAGSAAQVGATGATTYRYKLTAVSATTNEESLPSGVITVVNGNATLSVANHILITWGAVTDAGLYNIYREINGQYGFIGISGGTDFKDTGYTPDALDTPPVDRQPFSGVGNYPSAITFYQQRLMLGGTNNNTDVVYGSKSALRKNFMVSTPLQDDDAVTFAIIGRRINKIEHLLDIGRLVVFTTTGEWVIEGDAGGVLTPTSISPRQHSESGIGSLRPIVVGGSAVFLQARGRIVRDLLFDYQVDGYRGNDLSIFSSHLLKNETIMDWDYQQNPNSVLWSARSDGTLLGMTYIREHEINGWHHHDFDGEAENVCVVPEGDQDVVYLGIQREINGRSVRYLEYFKSREVADVVDLVLMDCSLSFDGRNTNTAHTMTLSGGINWTYDEILTLTSSTAYFSAAEISNAIHLTGPDGTIIRFTIIGYTSTTVVTGQTQQTVPTDMRSAVSSNWSRAVDVVSGLWHIEGKQVSVFADGFVVASPNNPSIANILTVLNGSITLDKPYVVIHVGLPVTSDIRTLNIDMPGTSSMADKKKLISSVSVFLEASRGYFVGIDENSLRESDLLSEEDYAGPPDTFTGVVDVMIEPRWEVNGSVFLRCVDPTPLNILAIIPAGFIP